jgi:hypothetical protein
MADDLGARGAAAGTDNAGRGPFSHIKSAPLLSLDALRREKDARIVGVVAEFRFYTFVVTSAVAIWNFGRPALLADADLLKSLRDAKT